MAKILVVDDDPSVLKYVKGVLKAAGHDVSEATNGRECLIALKDQPVDLLVTDIIMPEQEGMETIRILRREGNSLKIIAMTGGLPGGATDLVKMAKMMGVDKALGKPFMPADILAAVNEVLGKA
jgi:DNA-binding response OmpR family regulator